ncbi:hypothetical protein KP22_16835 [Pectobacterium betavasculorum]|uniref:Uncharacterized protein n=2 Tax=Pectobacterium betavasculorum TaxID=55207 RepID=A0A093U497_9GAMM|nr:hypothetical protein KP22_16835 [Pectobacterium betavasculorum]KFX15301.1 hypothetical protein JV35_18695 [Pectobacterium betavasculorum]
MNTETENAIRSVAKSCRSEIINATAGQPKKNHDPIITRILDKHAKRITALPPNSFSAKLWLSYFVRVVDAEAK